MLMQIFKIKKEERSAAGLFFYWQLLMQIAVIIRYYPRFSVITKDYRKVFLDWFHISGFDPLTYCVVTDWSTAYNVYRHPLLAFYFYPVYLINRPLMALTGINCTQFLVAALLLFCSLYAFLLMIRIGRELIYLSQKEATLLGFLLFSFAYVMLSAISPDHFIFSLFLILIVIYVTGKQMQEGRCLKKGQTILLFLLTAGISLNNGLKVILANCFSRGKNFFRPSNLLFAILLPSAALWGFSEWENKTFVADGVHTRQVKRARAIKNEKAHMLAVFRDTTQLKDSAGQVAAFDRIWKIHRQEQIRERDKEPQYAHAGTPVSKRPFLNWTDITTSRATTLVENLFGESIQLHSCNTLGDVMRDRPVIVHYSWPGNYIIEAGIILFFAAGLWAGRRSRFLWLAFSFFSLDMVLHIGLGFGINEVYIMTAHWAYVIPVSIGFLIKGCTGKRRNAITALTAILTLYLITYNSILTLLSL
ncbi:hypothetical protein J5A64_02585 [Prevotella denticola]|uniref:DUF6080 domain-containing protein n=1 Tax=Prevotella denticola TaxID=28129 RepID=UPI001BC85141|nr:DUF6080 domain-containing protein [Prevotella denticola]QUI94171.1 hypothetical protein J5A64_02585 [Prevotella denticola]